MIDPVHITNYQRTSSELEELVLFCIAVAGKNATTTSANLERLLEYGRSYVNGTPFEIIRYLSNNEDLELTMKVFGFGCFKVKSKGFIQIVNSGFDLKTCTIKELESIHGIGMKTARFFVLHTRKNARVACLDTHILKWLSSKGHDAPKQTPAKKKYLELENIFLGICDDMNVIPADLDLNIWNTQRGS